MCVFYRCRTSVSINVSIVENHFLKAADSARVELGRLFHQLGTVKVKRSRKVILCCSLANHKLLEYTYSTSKVVRLGMGCRACGCSGKHQCLKFDASGM